MAYEVIARKTRPQSFQDLKGQSVIRKTLTNAIENDRLHHALLFNGPRGTGKTSTARILAKILRCTNLQEGYQPCQKCDDCLQITEGRSLDVLEIDGASNNGVDSIRELRDRVSFHASTGSKKIYIVDEVHMLSTSAFNALLKTLEEPPPGVYFMMATTELHKVPKTILSRCQRYDFKPVPLSEVQKLLQKVCDDDNISYEQDALFLLAQAGEGCVRDSYSFLDQCITFSEGKLTASLVRETLGLTDISFFEEILSHLIHKKNLDQSLKKISSSSVEPQVFMEDLVKHVKNIILAKISQNHLQETVTFSETEKTLYTKLASQAELEDLFILFDICFKGTNDLLRAFDPRILLEITLMKAVSAPYYSELGETVVATSPATMQTAEIKSQTKPQIQPQAKPTAAHAPQPASPTTPQQTNNQEPAEESAPTSWGAFVKKIKGLNAVVGAKLEMCAYSFDKENKTLKISEGSKANFLRDQIKSDDFLNPLRNYVKSFWGQEYNVLYAPPQAETEFKKSHQDQKEINKAQQKSQAQQQVENHDVIKKIQEKHKIKINHIKEISE